MKGRRGEILFYAIGAVAIANGVLAGLSLYAILAAGLRLVGEPSPPLAGAAILGALAGVILLGLALHGERSLREGGGPWVDYSAPPPEASLAQRFNGLVASSSLQRAPELRTLDVPDPNAFAVGRSRDSATVAVTGGLLDLLDEAEQDAVLAHQLARVESEDIRAVGRADAVATSIGQAADLKKRVLWEPKDILIAVAPIWAFVTISVLIMQALPKAGEHSSMLEQGELLLLQLAIGIAWLVGMYVLVRRSWRGIAQAFLFFAFLGPLTAVEFVLAPPTALALSRLISRTRVQAADARSVELTRDPPALISALRKLEAVERSPDRAWLGQLRFSLFVTARAQGGYRAWLERIYSTHPSIAARIEAIEELDQVAAGALSGSRSC